MIRKQKINNFNINKIKDINYIFEKYPHIYSVFLFGSYAAGRETPLSDIDICYLSTAELDDSIESGIAEEICLFFKTDEVDFVSFLKLSIRTKYDILVNGKIIYLSNEEKFCDIKEMVIREYLDFKYYIDEYDRYFKESIKNGTYFE